MANCLSCGRNVGCGCNLNDKGLCASCVIQEKEKITVNRILSTDAEEPVRVPPQN